MLPLRRFISSVLMLSLLATFIHGPLQQVGSANVRNDLPETISDENGLQFRLSNGVEQPEARPASKHVTGVELSQSEIEAMVKRLPPMKIDPNSVQEFALREGSLPPPRTGNTIETSFPAPAAAVNEAVTPGPLEVVRYSPEGGVPIRA